MSNPILRFCCTKFPVVVIFCLLFCVCAVLVGRLLQGNVLPAAAQAAAVFVADCLKATPDEADERLGVWLESVLPQLMQNPE